VKIEEKEERKEREGRLEVRLYTLVLETNGYAYLGRLL
jgi:hypothetical protein